MRTLPIYPALRGVQLRCGKRQSIPSKSIANWAAAKAILPSFADGHKPAFLKSLAEQACTLSIPPDDLDQVTAPPTKDKQMTRERILLQCLLRLGCQLSERKGNIPQLSY